MNFKHNDRMATLIDCHVILGIATKALREIAKEDRGNRDVARDALTKIKEREKLSPAGKEIVEGLTKITNVGSREPIEDHFKVPIPKESFDMMSRSQLIDLLEKVRSSLECSEDAKGSCIYLCELLGVVMSKRG